MSWSIDDDIATAREVAAAQQAILEDQLKRGVVSKREYRLLSKEIREAGEYLAEYKAENHL